MKLRALVFILTLTGALWAQSANQAAPAQGSATASAGTQMQCPCCQKAADGKTEMACCQKMAGETMSCPHHKDKAGMSCCAGDKAKSCMKADKDKSADTACANGKCCGMKHDKDCCATAGDKDQKTAMACCRHGQCEGMGHHDNQAATN